MNQVNLKQAYQYCNRTVREHYENFPVASQLLPRKLRRPITVIYTFARMADDIVDEGTASKTERNLQLQQCRDQLDAAASHRYDTSTDNISPVYIALKDVLQQHPDLLPHLHDLLTAFQMDIDKDRYQNFAEVMQYCKLSANPIGRMLLILYDSDNEKNRACSDGLCSALQLINFLQDIRADYHVRNRIYLPEDEMQANRISEQDIAESPAIPELKTLMEFQIQRARKLLQAGAPLGIQLKGRIGLELRMITLGGWIILKKLREQNGDLSRSPRLNKRDWLWLLIRAISARFTVYLNTFTKTPEAKTNT